MLRRFAALLLLLVPHRTSGRASIRVVRSTLGCGVARSSLWTRTVCFGYPVLDGETLSNTGLVWAEVNLTVRVLPADEAQADSGDARPPLCGDALRVRFVSRTSLFAPHSSTEVECGVHTLRFLVPPDASAFRADVWVVHVDGEGRADPPSPRLYPANLADTPHGDGEGPRLFNVRVEGWGPGALRAGREYVAAHSEQNHQPLPLCTSGDGPGHWKVGHPALDSAGFEPLSWHPYGCRWRHVSGARLAECLRERGPVKWIGESTLGEVYESWQMHANLSTFFWPPRVDAPHNRVRFETPLMRARGWHLEYHGLSSALDGLEASLTFFQPAVLIHLQGANDAARDSEASWVRRLGEYTALLKGIRERHPALRGRLLWVTAPTRHYKGGAGPGSAICPNGTLASCHTSGLAFAEAGDGGVWRNVPSTPPLFFGTLDRRRAFNRLAVAELRRAFGDEVEIVDYEGLTAALPADYCIDGEHWGCGWTKWAPRRREAYQCFSAAVLTLSNILANLVCEQ